MGMLTMQGRSQSCTQCGGGAVPQLVERGQNACGKIHSNTVQPQFNTFSPQSALRNGAQPLVAWQRELPSNQQIVGSTPRLVL